MRKVVIIDEADFAKVSSATNRISRNISLMKEYPEDKERFRKLQHQALKEILSSYVLFSTM